MDEETADPREQQLLAIEMQVGAMALGMLKDCERTLRQCSTPTTEQRNVLKKLRTVKTAQEAMNTVSQYYTDPDEAFDGWLPMVLGIRGLYIENESMLYQIRSCARLVTSSNEIAKAIVLIYDNFVIGTGLTLEVSAKAVDDDPEKLAAAKPDATLQKLQTNWQKFDASNKMSTKRASEWLKRDHRDGETFQRLFKGNKKFAGIPQIRFVEPYFISGALGSKVSLAGQMLPSVGVQVDGFDEEVQIAFNWRDPGNNAAQPTIIPAERMIHTQRNVDMNMRRGVSSYYPILANLRRLEKLLVNISVLGQIQTAIALIRKHPVASMGKIQSFQAARSDGRTHTNPTTGRSTLAQKLPRGSIIDANAGVEYEFPSQSTSATQFLETVIEEMKHVAGNFQVAWQWLAGQETDQPVGPGSPITANFRSEQGKGGEMLTEVFWKIQAMMGVTGIEDLKPKYTISVTGPNLAMGAALDEAKIDEIHQRAGAISPQTIAKRRGLQYTHERANTIKHRATRQDGEVMPGDAGSGTPNGEQGGGGDGETKKDGGTRGGAKSPTKK